MHDMRHGPCFQLYPDMSTMGGSKNDNPKKQLAENDWVPHDYPRSERLALKRVLEETANAVNETFEIESYTACVERRNPANEGTYLTWRHLLDVDNLLLSISCRHGDVVRLSVTRGDRVLERAETPHKLLIRRKESFLFFTWSHMEGTERFQVKFSGGNLQRFSTLISSQSQVDYDILDAEPPSSEPDFSQATFKQEQSKELRAMPPSSNGISVDLQSPLAFPRNIKPKVLTYVNSSVKTVPIYCFSRADDAIQQRHWRHLSSVSGLELSLLPGPEPRAVIERQTCVLERIRGAMSVQYTGPILVIKYYMDNSPRRIQLNLNHEDVLLAVEYFHSRGVSVTCSETLPTTGTTYITSDHANGV